MNYNQAENLLAEHDEKIRNVEKGGGQLKASLFGDHIFAPPDTLPKDGTPSPEVDEKKKKKKKKKNDTDKPTVENPYRPLLPDYEGHVFTVLDQEDLSWTNAKRVRSLLSSQQLYSKVAARRSKSDQDVSAQFQALDTGQQDLVNNLIEEKNAAEKEPDTEWKLFGVSKLFADRKTASETLKVNTALRVTLRRGYKAEGSLGSDVEEKSAKRPVSSEHMTDIAAPAARSKKGIDSEGRKNVTTTETAAEQPISSTNDLSGIVHPPTRPSPGSMLPFPQPDDSFHDIHGSSSVPPPTRPSAIPMPFHLQPGDPSSGEFTENIPDEHDSRQRMASPLTQDHWGRQHGISRLQENVPDIQNELQDVRPKSSVQKRRKIMNAFLDRERSKQPGGRDNGTLSPSIKPLLPEGTNLHSPTHALLLASKSNYRNLLEGNHLLGISYPDSLSTGLTSKRTSHKVAKQGHRNRINDALKEMRALIPASSGSRAEKLMTKGGGGDDDSQETKEKDSPRRKLRGSVNDLEIAIEDTRGHEQTILAGNSRPESFGANFRDTDTEASGSHAWETSSAGEAGIVEKENVSEARMSLQCEGREASPPDEPRSTQIEIASKDEPPNSIHDDVDVAAFPASKSSWSLEHDANLAGNSQLSKNVAKFLVSTKDLEPILFASFLGMSIHDLSERQLNNPWDVVLGVVSILLAAIAYLAYIHLDLKSCGNSGGAMEGHGEKETPMADRSDLRDSLYNSEAYNTFSVEPFDFVHASYEKRILSAVGGDLEQSGVRLEEDVIHHIAREISWVPVHYLDFSDDTSLSYADATKAFIETYMGESWNWWPLAPRLYQLRQGYCRLQWKSPCGTVRHVDLPEIVKKDVQQAIRTAPAFINIGLPSRKYAHSSCGHGSGQASTSGTSSAMSQSGSGAAATSSLSLGSSSQSQQIGKPAPVTSPGSNPAATDVQSQHVDQHLSLCVVSSSRHFVSLRCDVLGSDLELFAKMKADYDINRGRLRLWFSMWRYKCSEFVLFHKYGYGRGARVDVGFPDDNDQMYHFLPRKPTPPPPNGPISKEQFQDHYYLDHCPCLYDWKRYQLSYRGHFNKANRVALDAVPKRLVRINMEDGVNEHFYGLYAKEERSFLRVAIYAFLCNLPGVIFFFLWLFQWQHASDLQNASVPLTLSLSLTLGFAAVVFGTRDGD